MLSQEIRKVRSIEEAITESERESPSVDFNLMRAKYVPEPILLIDRDTSERVQKEVDQCAELIASLVSKQEIEDKPGVDIFLLTFDILDALELTSILNVTGDDLEDVNQYIIDYYNNQL